MVRLLVLVVESAFLNTKNVMYFLVAIRVSPSILSTVAIQWAAGCHTADRSRHERKDTRRVVSPCLCCAQKPFGHFVRAVLLMPLYVPLFSLKAYTSDTASTVYTVVLKVSTFITQTRAHGLRCVLGY